MIEIIKKTFPPKTSTVCEKSNFCKIQGMPHVNTVDTCMQRYKEPS